ncbi:hypothetical protein [Salmonella enterica]|uniref:hypothetical protein n=1 Tax=Salmonella enterica TaxID=28901 RepID=UPI0011BF0710|nr:hypothetical protein [Salmonella enterica]TXC16651.1 hypothetical protein DP148_26260 [Salmonella enterica subsp. enterica serovar Typhimurium]
MEFKLKLFVWLTLCCVGVVWSDQICQKEWNDKSRQVRDDIDFATQNLLIHVGGKPFFEAVDMFFTLWHNLHNIVGVYESEMQERLAAWDANPPCVYYDDEEYWCLQTFISSMTAQTSPVVYEGVDLLAKYKRGWDERLKKGIQCGGRKY